MSTPHNELGMDEHADHQDDPDVPDQLRVMAGEWQVRHDIDRALGGPEQGDQAAEDQQRCRRKEGRAAQQAVEGGDIADAIVVAEHPLEPMSAVDAHRDDQARLRAGSTPGKQRVAGPADDEPDEDEYVDNGNSGHGRQSKRWTAFDNSTRAVFRGGGRGRLTGQAHERCLPPLQRDPQSVPRRYGSGGEEDQ